MSSDDVGRDAAEHLAQARQRGDEIAMTRTRFATVIVATRAPASAGDDALIPLADAAIEAATSLRVVRDAIRRRELRAFGKQRDRAVRRGDLRAWIASRGVTHAPIEDDDIARRMRRLERDVAPTRRAG